MITFVYILLAWLFTYSVLYMYILFGRNEHRKETIRTILFVMAVSLFFGIWAFIGYDYFTNG